MAIPLFDAQAGCGGVYKGQRAPLPVDECLAFMKKLDVGRALVRIEPDALDIDGVMSNDRLFEICELHEPLTPCPVAIPATAYDLPNEPEQVDGFVRHGAGAAMIRPQHDDWQLVPWVTERLFTAMQDRRLPLYCLAQYVPMRDLGEIATRYPQLPMILAQTGYRDQRTIVPLLETFGNVHLSIGNNWTIHRGIEQLVDKVGARQLLFGTGFPAAEPMMAVTQLMYAEISDEERRLIGAGNMERLLAEVS